MWNGKTAAGGTGSGPPSVAGALEKPHPTPLRRLFLNCPTSWSGFLVLGRGLGTTVEAETRRAVMLGGYVTSARGGAGPNVRPASCWLRPELSRGELSQPWVAPFPRVGCLGFG